MRGSIANRAIRTYSTTARKPREKKTQRRRREKGVRESAAGSSLGGAGGKRKIETEKHEERGARAAAPYEKDRISG
jgi:hypothetical protein